MERTVSQRELRNEAASVLRDVQGGQTFVITRNGSPVAELRPLSSRRFVARSVIAQASRRAPRIDAARFFADVDAALDQSVDA